MKKSEYKKLLKATAMAAAMTCASFEIPSTVRAEVLHDVSEGQAVHVDIELPNPALLASSDVKAGEQQVYQYTNYFAQFYGLNQEDVHNLFLEYYDELMASGNMTQSFINVIEDSIALENLMPSATIDLPLATRSRERIHEVKNTEIGSLFQKYCTRYGVDMNLVLAQFMQESGLQHDEFNPNGAYGITQIENTLFDSKVEVYNFETGAYETIKITEDKARDLETNIQIGVAKVQEKMRQYNYNVYMGLQSYNYGTGMFNHVLGHYEERTNTSSRELIHELNYQAWKEDVQFVHNNPAKYTKEEIFQNGAKYGDDDYISNVLSYLETPFVSYQTVDGLSLYLNLNTGTMLSTNRTVASPEMEEYVSYIKSENKEVEKRRVR